jgi:hypothetical protein
MEFLTPNNAKLCKKLLMTLFFEKNAIFSPKELAKKWRFLLQTMLNYAKI